MAVVAIKRLVGPYVTDPAKRVFDGIKHCGFYTQDDIREVVAYAAERFITVVPEIEMPGTRKRPSQRIRNSAFVPTPLSRVLGVWGVSEYIFNANPSTIAFLQDVLTEVLALFPGKWIHVGGDERSKLNGKPARKFRRASRSLGLKDEHELQSWFIRQMDGFLTARGRRLVGWDEILEGGIGRECDRDVVAGCEGWHCCRASRT